MSTKRICTPTKSALHGLFPESMLLILSFVTEKERVVFAFTAHAVRKLVQEAFNATNTTIRFFWQARIADAVDRWSKTPIQVEQQALAEYTTPFTITRNPGNKDQIVLENQSMFWEVWDATKQNS